MYVQLVLAALLLMLGSSIADSYKCMQSYQELQASIFADPNNIDNLRKGFYPTNEESSISVEFHYYFHTMTLPYPLVFRWSASRSLVFIRPEFLSSLTLYMFRKITPVVEIALDPPCNDPGLNFSLSDWESICRDEKVAPPTLQLLNELTANVS